MTRTRNSASRLLLAAAAAAAVLAISTCSREKALPAWKADLEEVPPISHPESLEAPVAQQYRDRRGRVEELSKRPDANAVELGRAYGMLGMWHDVYGFGDLARACYGNAARLAPDDRRWPYYLGLLYQRSEPDKAREAFERALALSPQDVPTLVSLGEADLALGRIADAESRFRAALALSPEHVGALADLGAAALERKDYAAAVGLLEQALARQPDAAKIHHWLGLAYRGVGDTARAETHLAKVPADILAQIPIAAPDPLATELHEMIDGSRVHSRRAEFAARQGDRETVVREYRLAIAAKPDDAGIRLALARVLIDYGRGAEAIEPVTEALRRTPADPRAHTLLARALVATGDSAGAETHLRQALQLDATLVEAWIHLADLLARSGRLQEALPAYDKAIEIEPLNAASRYRRSVALLKLERYDDARKALEGDLSVASEDPPLKLLLARVLAASPDEKLRDAARALRLAAEGVKENARSGTSKNDLLKDMVFGAITVPQAETLAMAYAENRKFDRAVAWQGAAVTAVEGARRDRGSAWARNRLQSYQARKPCRRAIENDERLLTHVYVSPPADPLLSGN